MKIFCLVIYFKWTSNDVFDNDVNLLEIDFKTVNTVVSQPSQRFQFPTLKFSCLFSWLYHIRYRKLVLRPPKCISAAEAIVVSVLKSILLNTTEEFVIPMSVRSTDFLFPSSKTVPWCIVNLAITRSLAQLRKCPITTKITELCLSHACNYGERRVQCIVPWTLISS